MQAIVDTLWSVIDWIWGGISDSLGGLFDGIISAVVWVAEWLGAFLASVVSTVVEIILNFAEIAIGLLPDMPDAPDINGVSVLEQANAYLPVAESLALLGIWSTIFTGIGIYKLIKMISPVSS